MATKRYCHRIIKKKFIFPLLVTFSLLYIWWGVKTRALVGGLQGRIFSIQALPKIPAENQIRETSGQEQRSLHNHGAVNTTGSPGGPINSVEQHPAKKILFWTSFSGGPKEKRIGMFNRNNKCVVDKCELTIDPEEVTSADAVLFHLSFYTATKLPAYRRPSQLYVAYSREAPALVRGKEIRDYPDVFNVTMTYRRDSDVVVPYGVITPRTTPVDVNDYWQKKNKSLLVSWLVSNCKTSSRREAYVEILKRYIAVDVYGKCGNDQCGSRLGNQPHGCDFVYNDYMFYLAFENQIFIISGGGITRWTFLVYILPDSVTFALSYTTERTCSSSSQIRWQPPKEFWVGSMELTLTWRIGFFKAASVVPGLQDLESTIDFPNILGPAMASSLIYQQLKIRVGNGKKS